MEQFNKKELSERDICTKYITPAIHRAGWDLHTQLREEVKASGAKSMEAVVNQVLAGRFNFCKNNRIQSTKRQEIYI